MMDYYSYPQGVYHIWDALWGWIYPHVVGNLHQKAQLQIAIPRNAYKNMDQDVKYNNFFLIVWGKQKEVIIKNSSKFIKQIIINHSQKLCADLSVYV